MMQIVRSEHSPSNIFFLEEETYSPNSLDNNETNSAQRKEFETPHRGKRRFS
jgi:hypothetical protein